MDRPRRILVTDVRAQVENGQDEGGIACERTLYEDGFGVEQPLIPMEICEEEGGVAGRVGYEREVLVQYLVWEVSSEERQFFSGSI